jgi:hypothetical protein
METSFLLPFCSYSGLGAAGAEELVKGNWPELKILKIRWIWWLCIQQYPRNMPWHGMSSHVPKCTALFILQVIPTKHVS